MCLDPGFKSTCSSIFVKYLDQQIEPFDIRNRFSRCEILSCSPKALCFLQVEWKRSHQTLFRDRSKHFSRVKKAKFTSSLLRRHVTWSKSSSQAQPSGQKAKEVWRRTVRRRSILVLNHLPPIMSRICTTNISQAL